MIAESLIKEVLARGATAWPDVRVSLEQLSATAASLEVSEDGLRMWARDFYLACAAGCGDAAAIALIDELFVGRLSRRIQRLGATPDDAADILQMVRERLFTGERPRIRAYDGGGPLEQWIKVVAIRTAIDHHRVQQRIRNAASDLPVDVDPTAADPVKVLTKQQLKQEFETVLRSQVLGLSPRDRAVLRLHLIEGVRIDTIARARGVHRVTVARWIWNAGEILLDALRKHFRDRYGMVPAECESLAHLVKSQLSLDLPQILATE
jgi:RNA polymerase sigma-70 factor (ECF subfamily)